MTHRVREVHESDVPALMRLHLDVLDEGRWFISTPSEYTHDPFSLLEHVKEMRRRDNCGWWVVAVNGAPVGFATVTGGHLARITHVARFEVMVARAHRGKGIGHALTSHAVAWARTCPVLHKLSLAVFDDNERAIGLYRALGFHEEGRRPGEYREADGSVRGDVLMSMDVH